MATTTSIYCAEILEEVAIERSKQNRKWGANQELPPQLWLTILMKEVGEACQATLSDKRRIWVGNAYRHELIQVAAVAVAAVECFDRREEEKDNG